METALVKLPDEIVLLSDKVPAEKKTAVLAVLNQIFAGTSEWEKQVDAIEVKGIDDTMSISLANMARKNVKNARLDGEKIFDSKRSEVQARMIDDKLEDALWLKAKQIMQLTFKHIEEKAEEKSKYIERHEAKVKADRKALRESELLPFAEFVNPEYLDLLNMSEDGYQKVLTGAKLQADAKIEAEKKAEQERIAEAARVEAQRVENERLKKEAEEKEKEIQAERIRVEKEKAEAKAKADAERKALEEKAAKEKAESDAKLKAEKERADKLAAEVKAKADAETKRIADEKLKVENEKKAQELADKKAKAAPDKEKLVMLVDELKLYFDIQQMKTRNGELIYTEIFNKFNAFKSWAKTQIETI